MMERRRYIVSGQVQGVGFRPFVYRTALALGLTGHVGNAADGVRIEVQGENVAAFGTALARDLPPLARVTSLREEVLPLREDESSFSINASHESAHSGHRVLISPDMALCDACLADMRNPQGRRHGYAFTNCTDCGPRYSITRSIPYDRPFTSMACFPLCEDCRREYENPLDRRFHAQPNACPVCGPELWLEETGCAEKSPLARGPEALAALARALAAGRIAAIKGLGGFHLACDAQSAASVAELRRRKRREHKALAVMARDLDVARSVADLDAGAEAALTSPRRPIVICPRRPGALPSGLAPDTGGIGLMLPYTPLHQALFDAGAPELLVMTSGNAGGEPICLGNREAKAALADMADVFLLHNRDILVRVDDSVLFPARGASQGGEDGGALPAIMIRRSRGYAPEPLLLAGGARRASVLATGAELKHTFCLTRGSEAFVSQHIGNVSRPGQLAFFEETLAHLLRVLEVEPELVVRDLHPDYLSSRLAEDFARERGLPLRALQHHFAHLHAVLAEHGRSGASGEPVLGLMLDGSGLGDDGTIWGGELLWAAPEGDSWAHRRLGRFAPFALPGGEAAIREPWRIAEALDLASVRPWARDSIRAAQAGAVREIAARGLAPFTSSCGRLFDAVAALCGLCFAISYEGQAAVLLEEAQDMGERGAYRVELCRAGDLLELDARALALAVAEDRAQGVAVGRVARRFHLGLARGLADWTAEAAAQTGTRVVALGGGVLNNRTLARELDVLLRARGLAPLFPSAFPPGDGAIALGQAHWAVTPG